MDLDSLLNESKKYLKDEVEFCSIINARNGKCSQNCKYCAQSSHYNTEIESYPLMEVNEVLEAARDSQKNGADRVAIVTSGKTPDESDFDTMLDMIKALNKEGIKSCASIGILNKNQAKKLAETGLVRFHHNINTCRSYHPEICTTHTYEDRINTAKLVKKYGMELCCGVIIGMGESIEQRPEEIDGREGFGHWEGDTVYSGKGKRKTTRALLTMTERKTRKEIIIAIPNRKAETVVKALDALERKLGARRFRAIFKSITFDNGTEFAAAEGLERSCVNKRLPRTKVYFCHPYSSWERGTNENTNGMIRRRFPKGTNFAAVTNAQIAQAENWINNYPRKILGYKSSEIVFRECLRELGIAA